MNEREEFDRIVDGLEIDIEKITEDVTAEAEASLYRARGPATIRLRRLMSAAIVAVLLLPASMIVAAVVGHRIGLGLLVALTGVAAIGAVYLIWKLPSHGPADDDWPNDGAVL